MKYDIVFVLKNTFKYAYVRYQRIYTCLVSYLSNPILRPCKAKTMEPNSWLRSRATEELELVCGGPMSTKEVE